ncbi:MAG: type I-E CRISPR-associated protein Cse1/CasA [Chloroflexi bacterium]|nr:MAG: type I-E CRISPR-associated protein Cse1/CasA [Chloroflexota bacterium]
MWRSPAWDMERINAYLDAWRHRFDLFAEERPFYQSDSNDKRAVRKSIVTLKYGTGFRHNPLFDHDNDVRGLTLSPANAARNLLVVQAFGLGGDRGMLTDAPWSKGVVFFVHGSTLKETLFLNLLPYPDKDGGERIPDFEDDKPTWEMDEPFIERGGQPLGYLDLLTWQNHKVMLFPKRHNGQLVVREVKFGGGLRIAKDLMDPMKLILKNEKFPNGFKPVSFEESRGLWANSYALFARMSLKGGTTSWPPLAFNWLGILVDQQLIEPYLVYRCKAIGLGKNKGKVEYLREERFPFPLRYLVDEDLRNRLRDALRGAEQVSKALYNALCRTGMYLLQPSADNFKWEELRINTQNDGVQRDEISKSVKEEIVGRWERGQLKKPGWIKHTEADIYFWSYLDIPFQEFIVRLAEENSEKAIAWWKTQIRAAATGAFAKAKQYAYESERALRAIVAGQTYLERQLDKMLGKEEHT